jgi:membrane protein implicated in regulation of membrane protease activity
VVEVETAGLVSAWFACGGVAALVLASLDIDWMWQVIAFVVVSLGTFVAFRPLARKFMKTPTVPTNADVNFGKKFKLLADVKGGRSTVKVNDVVWTVLVDTDLKAGDFVILKDISGNKYIAETAASKPSVKVKEDK